MENAGKIIHEFLLHPNVRISKVDDCLCTNTDLVEQKLKEREETSVSPTQVELLGGVYVRWCVLGCPTRVDQLGGDPQGSGWWGYYPYDRCVFGSSTFGSSRRLLPAAGPYSGCQLPFVCGQ